MDRDRINALAWELEELVSREGAALIIQPYGDDPEQIQLRGNELGFLRLGVELLRGGLQATASDEGDDALLMNIDYLHAPESPLQFNDFRFVTFPPAPPPSQSQDWSIVAAIGWLAFFVILVVIFIAGIASVLGWLSS